jgi:hypothetical protein
LGLGVVVTLTVTPSAFTVDDLNYLITVLAARGGHVTVANTEGLTPSRELLFFDPAAALRAVQSTPVAPATPPLYGPLAVPFSWFGWRGLVALNTLSYLATIGAVFMYANRYASQPQTSWIAAGAFALGGYAIEYAQGLWPHALSFALCVAGIILAGRAVEGTALGLAAASGFSLGLATGIRYQNAAIVAAVATGIVFLAQSQRWRTLWSFAVGAAVPLTAVSFINHSRLGSWNPISKGPGYLGVPADLALMQRLSDVVTLFWAQLVDYSIRPPFSGSDTPWLAYGSVTGAHLILGLTVKKAFIQSAPWAILSFITFAAAWRPAKDANPSRQRQLRLQALVVGALVSAFSLAGLNRNDGLAFNARYLLELFPFAAVAFAWSLDKRPVSVPTLLQGAMAGSLIALAILTTMPADGERSGLGVVRNLALLKLPLVMALGVLTLWWVDSHRAHVRTALLTLAGVSLGWGLTVHIVDDVAMAHRLRTANLSRTQIFERAIPDKSALLVYWGSKDAVGPVLLNRDLVVLDVHADAGRDAPMLIRELIGQGRRVFLLKDGVPMEMLDHMLQRFRVTPVAGAMLSIVELSIDSA